MKKILLISFICFFTVFNLFAEEKSVYNEYDQALGGFYGEIGGKGLSYQQWFDDFGIEAAAGFMYSGGDNFTFNIGAQVQFLVYQDSFGDWFTGGLYAWAGALYGATVSNTAYTPAIGIGAGIGVEPVLFEHFSIPLEFGYGGNWGFDSIVPTLAGIKFQGGLRYRF